MNETNIRVNSIMAWILAARPKTLTGAAVPVMIALAMVYNQCGCAIPFRWTAAALCLLFAFIMQIDANFINDYFDFLHGNDDETRLGPLRACAQGWVTMKAMRLAIVLTTLIACGIGMPLIIYGGWQMMVVGSLCVVFCFLYTTKLSYLGLGDILVLLFFGIVPVCVTYYIQLHVVSMDVMMASVACGLVIDTLLVVNNYRDIDNDRKAGKQTLIVHLGSEWGRYLYLWLGIVACAIGAVHCFHAHLFAFVLPIIVYLFLHVKTYRSLCHIEKGKELNRVLGMTARNMFIYGLMVTIGLLI